MEKQKNIYKIENLSPEYLQKNKFWDSYWLMKNNNNKDNLWDFLTKN